MLVTASKAVPRCFSSHPEKSRPERLFITTTMKADLESIRPVVLSDEIFIEAILVCELYCVKYWIFKEINLRFKIKLTII